jgi:hypothetical protein
MPMANLNLDEDDVSKVGKIFLPFFLLIILSLFFQQYWETLTFQQQLALIVFLIAISTLIYRSELKEMLYD